MLFGFFLSSLLRNKKSSGLCGARNNILPRVCGCAMGVFRFRIQFSLNCVLAELTRRNDEMEKKKAFAFGGVLCWLLGNIFEQQAW